MSTPTNGPNPLVLTSGRFDRAHPHPEALAQDPPKTLLETLDAHYFDDRHFAAYAPQAIGDSYCRLKAGALPVEMILLVFDVDGPDHKATPEWRSTTAARLPTGALWYATGGGLRVIFALEWPSILKTAEDCAAWSAFYDAACVAAERMWGLVPDTACSDWTRLYRLPKVTRDDMPTWAGAPLPLGWQAHAPLLWDENWITEADYEAAELRAANGAGRARGGHSGAPTGEVEDTFLFRVLEAADWDFGETRGNWTNVECPWVSEHTTGGDEAGICGNDDEHPGGPGVFNCYHGHCKGRDVKDVLAHPKLAPIVARMRQQKRAEVTALADAFWKEMDSRGSSLTLARQPVAESAALVLPKTVEEMMDDWNFKIVKTKQGVVLNTPHNTLATFELHPSWYGAFGYDEFRREVILLRDVVALPFTRPAGHVFHADDDPTLIRGWFSYQNHNPSTEDVIHSVTATAKKAPFHSVRQYLQALPAWDGVDRNLVDYLGAEPSVYQRAVCAKWMRSAVARAMVPGCKADTMLILEGKQGAFKSTALKCLCPDTRWFYENSSRKVGDKDFMQDMGGKWICEIPEVDFLIRSREESELKALLSRTADRYRPSYARAVGDFPRQMVFAGTTNLDNYLKDPTGNRRYWVVKCQQVGPIQVGGILQDLQQIWAQALSEYSAGEPWWLDAVEDGLAADEQDDRLEQDPWAELLEGWLAARPRDAAGEEIPFSALEALAALPGAMTGAQLEQKHMNRVGRVLRSLGYTNQVTRQSGGKRARKWARHTDRGGSPEIS